MAFWDRIKGAVNSLLGRSPDVPPPPEIPTGDYIPTSDYIPPPRYEESAGDYDETEYHMVDDFGRDWGWQTQEEWRQDTYLSGREIRDKYGDDYLLNDLLDWYQDQFGEWTKEDWRDWRRDRHDGDTP